MTQHKLSAGKLAVMALAVIAAVALPMSASAHDHGGYGYHGGHHDYDGGRRGYDGGHRGYDGGYYGRGYGHGGHWNGGRWIAGALVAGAVVGLVDNALSPRGYYQSPVVYSQPATVVYEDGPPVVTRRVIETRTVTYEDPYQTRYVGNDGY